MNGKSILIKFFAIAIGALTFNTTSAQVPENVQNNYSFVDGILMLLVNNGDENVWQRFKWLRNKEANTSTLFPTEESEAITRYHDMSDALVFNEKFTFKITDRNNHLIAVSDFAPGARVKDFVSWIGAHKFISGDSGLEVSHTSNKKMLKFYGNIDNYINLSFENAIKMAYVQYAFVPNENRMYARFVNQDVMNTDAFYTFKTKSTDSTKFVGFNLKTKFVALEKNKQRWKLEYDPKRFAYRIMPENSERLFMFWDNPGYPYVTIRRNVDALGSLGQYWHFKKNAETGEYNIIPYRASSIDYGLYINPAHIGPIYNSKVMANYRLGSPSERSTFYVLEDE